MSDFTHARVCIRHASGSVEIQAPAGEVTWLDLSGLHALPVVASNGFRRKRPLLTAFLFLGCSAAVGAGVVFVGSDRSPPLVAHSEPSALELAAPQQPIPLGVPVPSIGQALRSGPVPAAGPLPAAHDADPFGLRLK